MSRDDRKRFWNDINAFCDTWMLRNPSCKILITGDLNTRDIRFGITHSENHSYLDPLLTTFEIISKRHFATRENNTLDVTLGNQNAKNSITRWSVMDKLNSDPNLSNTEIKLRRPPYGDTQHTQYKRNTTYTVNGFETHTKQNTGSNR